jgi:hypothetical protein
MAGVLTLVACTGEDTGVATVERTSSTCEPCGGACTLESIPSEGGKHDTGVIVYDDYPPTSGDHDPCWAAWGVHPEPVAPDRWVHNMEHGGVVFLYDPLADAEDVAAATALVEQIPPGRALLTPATEPFAGPWAVVSWQWRLLADCYDGDAFAAFFDAHEGSGPEDAMSAPDAGCMDDSA